MRSFERRILASSQVQFEITMYIWIVHLWWKVRLWGWYPSSFWLVNICFVEMKVCHLPPFFQFSKMRIQHRWECLIGLRAMPLHHLYCRLATWWRGCISHIKYVAFIFFPKKIVGLAWYGSILLTQHLVHSQRIAIWANLWNLAPNLQISNALGIGGLHSLGFCTPGPCDCFEHISPVIKSGWHATDCLGPYCTYWVEVPLPKVRGVGTFIPNLPHRQKKLFTTRNGGLPIWEDCPVKKDQNRSNDIFGRQIALYRDEMTGNPY